MPQIIHDDPARRPRKVRDFQLDQADDAHEILVTPPRHYIVVPRSVLVLWFASDDADPLATLDTLQ